MWGWGSVIADEFNLNKISVENRAMAGRSARTFLDEGRWDKVYNALQPGDFVLIQFGHNDAGDINVGKARAELRGSGDESKVFLMEKTRLFIRLAGIFGSSSWTFRRKAPFPSF